MLDKTGTRQLAYVVIIDNITPIDGYDRVELAHVGGWTVVVSKGEFKPGDPAIYFEIDSKLPEVPPFSDMEFLAKKKFKIKTQKMCKSISSGLLMSAEQFGWTIEEVEFDLGEFYPVITDNENTFHFADDESRFLTEKLNVTYATAEDNKRKAKSSDKYKSMAQRHGKLFSHQPFRFMMKHTWGKKILFLFFGRKRDKKSSWPNWVKKTDEERCQNMPWILNDKSPWVVTEKIDGSSTTFTLKRKKFGRKYDFYVCSRNVVFDKPDKPCFYDSNIYLEMAKKYDIENKMKSIFKHHFPETEWITIQGETYGAKVQNRNYGLKGHDFKAFNFITSETGRFGTIEMKNFLEKEGIPCVDIINEKYILPDTIEELLEYANGNSMIDGEMREGIVLRSPDGDRSFKAVSNEYLIKYHA